MKCTVIFQRAVLCLIQTDNSELAEFFGELKQEGAAQKRRRPQSRQYPRAPHRDHFNEQAPREFSLLISLARQVIRQEEEIKVLRQDHALIFFMKPGEHNMLCHLYRTAQQFQKKQSENPGWTPGQQPLKAIMAAAVFNELGIRLDPACKEEDFALARDPAVGWKFQYWDPAVKHLVEDKSRKPITDQEVASHLQKLTQLLLLPDLVHRFGCKRRLTETIYDILDGPAIRTPQSLEAWGSLLALQGCTVLQLGGIAYRKETFKPSPGIVKIKEMLVLTNSGNACYMNSVVQVFYWLLVLRPAYLATMGAGRTFFQALQTHHCHNPKNLLKDKHWRALIEGWRDHHRQHDVAEFFSFLCQTHAIDLFQGQWEARRIYQGQLQVRDTALCTQPVTLVLLRTRPGLDVRIQVQSLLDYWSGAQKAVHAFSAPHPVLTFQVERFHKSNDRITKRRDPIDVDRDLAIPIFAGDQMQVRVMRYQLVATSLIMACIHRRAMTRHNCSQGLTCGAAMTIAVGDMSELCHQRKLVIAIC
ncbi:PRP2 [Symbiodinium sp. CCMP2592]|nr:PRP2 [Symbiodinium sp. CCMP2592]CAE7536544.1 PRP2 [Symbiodinium sp. CCMP2592]